MNNKVNYTAVGFLALLGLTLILGFSYWLLKPTVDQRTSIYNVYFDESVLGLNIDAPVKYRGISVGKVSKLRISPYNSEQVEVRIKILSTTPIKENTAAKLTAQGITGLSYINLSMGDHNAPALASKENQEYPVIKTIPSFFEDFENTLGKVSTNLSSTLVRTSELLNDENQKQITLLLARSASFMDKLERVLDNRTIANVQESVENLESISHKLERGLDKRTMANVQDSVENFESVSHKLDMMMPNIDAFMEKSIVWENNIHTSLASIMTSYLGIKSSMIEFERAVSGGEFNMKEIGADLIPTINNTLLEMQELIVNVEGSLNQHSRSPGDILFKQEEIKKGPGEK